MVRSYRQDIDGLRGIAVLAVIVYHIDHRMMPGGFVGVDVFFVISGFLITQLILTDLDSGQFTLANFYRRRIKRIAPAMMLVILVTLAAAQILLLPQDAVATAYAALASVAGAANIYFWLFQDGSYFAPHASELPLLHLWSLGVEEQYYLVWPLVLLAAHRRIISLPPWVLVLCAAASFIAGSLLFGASPDFVFYMLPTRAGELLVGALVAIAVLRGWQLRPGAGHSLAMAFAGVAILAGSLVFITQTAVFPGLLAVFPTLGTAALIMAGAGGTNPVSSALGTPVLRWTGLVSYSAYLWHWPLLAFWRYGYGEPSATAAAGLFVLTFVLAWLSYRFVERPTRASTRSFSGVFKRQYLAPASVIGIIGVASLVAAGYGLHIFQPVYAAQLHALEDRLRPSHEFAEICQRQRLQPADLDDPLCTVGSAPAAAPGTPGPRMLLWGDSNASHYVGIIRPFANAGHFSFRNAQIQSCPPLAGDPEPYLYARDVDNCRASLAVVRQRLTDFDVIAMAASWPGYLAERDDFLEQVFALALQLQAQGKLVLLLGKAPVPDKFDRRCAAKALRFPSMDCQSTPAPLALGISAVNSRLRAFASVHRNVEYFDLTAILCPNGVCVSVSKSGEPLYVDAHHLALAAAEELGAAVIAQDGLPAAFVRIANWQQTTNHNER